MYCPSEEMVAIVDRENNVTGAATRREMREKKLTHRCTYIVVQNSAGQLLVQRRTLTKDVYPGYLDPTTGGVVLAGESYEESAARELAEEMGISGVELETLFDFWFDHAGIAVWGRVFRCMWDGAVVPQPEEVVEVVLRSPTEVIEGKELYTPDGLHVIRRLFGSGERLNKS